MAVSVIRRYTPPTCTLEISARQSPLSRWADRPVLNNLRFLLRFDDPRLPEENHVTVTGDRDQLEALHETVQSYVQQLLESAPDQFDHLLLSSIPEVNIQPFTETDAAPAEPFHPSDRPVAPEDPDEAEFPLLVATEDGEAESVSDYGIRVTRKGLLEHELHLGELLPEGANQPVPLSTLQLFDLANALDEYGADAIALPALGRSGWLGSFPGWTKIAALLVAAVGVAGSVTWFVREVSPQNYQTASSSLSQGELPTAESAPLGVSPDNLAIPGAPPDGNFPSPGPLPPVSPVPTVPPLPQAGIPLPPPTAAPFPSAVDAPPATVFVPSAEEGAAFVNPAPAPARPVPSIQPLPSLAPVERPATTAREAAPARSPSAPPAQISRIDLPLQPNAVPANQPSPEQAIAPAPGNLPAPARDSRVADGVALSGQIPSEVNTAPFDPVAPAPPATTAARSTASAISPSQVAAEAQRYFRDRWQPPQSLTQTLEYRLLVNPDGTVAQIIPLGEQSGNYVDRTGIPLVGDPFLPPLESGQRALIRLVLNPDGTVQTFTENTP